MTVLSKYVFHDPDYCERCDERMRLEIEALRRKEWNRSFIEIVGKTRRNRKDVAKLFDNFKIFAEIFIVFFAFRKQNCQSRSAEI